ncbi:MAG TPA: hypothetical protein PKX92_14390 [Edaphocola sp.]|nr:hypothetical protein [Edaphocola sp.]
MANNHVYLINEKSTNPKFKRKRGYTNKGEEQLEPSLEPKFIKEFQKERLRVDMVSFYSQRKQRNEKRYFKFPQNIDLIRIYFHCVFNLDCKLPQSSAT